MAEIIYSSLGKECCGNGKEDCSCPRPVSLPYHSSLANRFARIAHFSASQLGLWKISPAYLVCFARVFSSCGSLASVRIIAGQFRSRILESLKGQSLRPTSDYLRETLFN